MADILFIKTSSLGDVIHHLPAVTDARAHRPDAQIAWVVEEAFAPLALLHPGADLIIPVAARRWTRAPLARSTWSELRDFHRMLRARRYDVVVDTQGLLKSALMARSARGLRHGYDTQSITERPASLFYDVRHRVGWDQHAIARNRALTGLALGYAPQGEPDFGLRRARIGPAAAAPYAVLLHATARPEKEWPEPSWRALIAALAARMDIVILAGTPAERARAERLASGVSNARVPERAPLDTVARLIAGASLVIGVDTGLLHLAAAFGVPLVAIFAATNPAHHGPLGDGPITILGGRGAMPSVQEVQAAIERLINAPLPP